MRINLVRAAEFPATVSSTSQSISGPSTTAKESSSVSGPAKFLAELEALKKSDPAAFKEKLDEISQKLTQAAESATDPEAKKMMTDLAAKFTKAGETGDLSGLTPGEGPPPPGAPPGPPPGGGMPPSSSLDEASGADQASGSSTSTATSTVYEPADTNQDGKVTYKEQQAYDEKMAALEGPSKAVRTYQEQARRQAGETVSALLSSVLESS